MVGWVKGAGRLGIDDGPEGGARFKAGPLGASGTEAGGTGGGRSENIWAELEAGISKTSAKASATAGKGHPARPSPPIPLPREVMAMLFTENAANSSLRSALEVGTTAEPAGTGDVNPGQSEPVTPAAEPLSPGINHAWQMQPSILAGLRRDEYLEAAGEF